MSFLRSPRPKFQNHLVFMTFHNGISVVSSFEVVWPLRPWRPRKVLGEYFQRLHFWNQWVPLIKMHCRVRYLLDFDLKIRSGQVWFKRWSFAKLSLLFFLLIKSLRKLRENMKHIILTKVFFVTFAFSGLTYFVLTCFLWKNGGIYQETNIEKKSFDEKMFWLKLYVGINNWIFTNAK